MEIVILIAVAALAFYFNSKINKIALSIGELSDRQTKVVVDFLVFKLQEKGIFNENEIESLFKEINQKILDQVKLK